MTTTANDKRDFFDNIAAQWDGFDGPPDASQKEREFIRLATVHRPSRILDVGCGTGVLVPHLIEERPCAKLTELDFSAEMIAVNRSKHNLPEITFCCGDLLSAPLAPAGFDAVLFFNVLPHFDDASIALTRAFHLLAERGRIAVGHLMGSAELNAFHAAIEGPVCHDRLPETGQLAALLSHIGFTVLQADERSDWYFVLAEKAAR